MHISKLRGTDFEIEWRGEPVTHAEFFAPSRETERVGIVAPHRFEAIGAITLVMAYVTAFYDRYRERSTEFFAYPDFFTFQREVPCADYGMFDIWPSHKNVHVPRDAQQTAEAITDRGVTVLLVPDESVRDAAIAPVERESARRSVKRCFAYSGTGSVRSSDLSVECRSGSLANFALAVFDSVPVDRTAQQLREQWLQCVAADGLRQSFRELDLHDALRRL